MRSNNSIAILLLLFMILNVGCLKDSNLNSPFIESGPIDLDDGLELSSPQSEGFDTTELSDAIIDIYNDENLWSIRSLLVLKNGKLVSETYFKNSEDISNKHLIWSCTKQVIGILTGIAIEEGIIEDLEDQISIYLPEIANEYPDKSEITIRDLLAMQSGIDYSNEEQTDQVLRQIPDDILDFILSQPLNSSKEFRYSDGNPQIIASIIEEQVGMALDDWAFSVLFSKIGISNLEWTKYKDGRTLGGFGIETTPRELAKIALLVSKNGNWNGDQLVNSDWILAMTNPQVEVNYLDYSMGYYWWVDESRSVSFMWGVGGQLAFVLPEKDLVVVITSFPNTKGEYEIQADEGLNILDSIRDAII